MTQQVTDDLGFTWTYHPDLEKIVMDEDDSEPADERGYYCRSFRHGVVLLSQYGYIGAKESTGHE